MAEPEQTVSESVMKNMEAIEKAADEADIFAAVVIGNPDSGHMLVYTNSKSNTAQTIHVLHQILQKLEESLATN